MTNGRKRVELKIYFKSGEEIVVDSYSATSWEDYLIVRLKGSDEMEYVASVINEMESLKDKYEQIILLPEGLEIEFYGIEEVVPES